MAVFDVGSTLVDESKVYEDRMKRIADLSGLTYEQIYKYAMSFYKENKKGDLEVARQLGVKLPKWESQYERLYTDTKDCLKKLSRIYKIGVIANQSLGTSERLENLGVRKYIDLIIASAEEGVSKPDRRIFEIALERSCCKPENAVMIGDRIDNDIVPAKQLGIVSVFPAEANHLATCSAFVRHSFTSESAYFVLLRVREVGTISSSPFGVNTILPV